MSFLQLLALRGFLALVILNQVLGNRLVASFQKPQDDLFLDSGAEHSFLSFRINQEPESSHLGENFEVEEESRGPLHFKLRDFGQLKAAPISLSDWSEVEAIKETLSPVGLVGLEHFPVSQNGDLRDNLPLVNTTLGPVLGMREEEGGVAMISFRGIPYAEPPLGVLRFMPPVPAASWGEKPLFANASASPCVQRLQMGSEDCLFLDIYTPEGALLSNSSLAVIVYIYGGGFMFGQGTTYDGAFPMLQRDVIVVVPQYRLGVLGFFSTGDDVAPGNQGLQDQTLALQFIRDNIASFGGDPDRVSLMGTSAGSVSSHFQMLAPSAAGLFSGVILQSGTVVAPWATGRDFNETATAIAKSFFCRAHSSEEIVSCLQDVNPHLLDDTMYTLMEWNGQPFKFAPRVDGTYILGEPAQLLKDGNFTHVPVVVGSVRDDGAVESTELYYLPHFIETLEDNFDVNGPISLMLYPDEDPLNTAHGVYDRYIGGNITEEKANNLTRLYTDRLFHMPLDWAVELMANHVPVFVHELHHRGEHGYTNYYMNHGLNISEAADWISHGEDVQYSFYRGNNGDITTEDDLEVRRILTTMWADFARTGSPTPDDATLGFQWPATTAEGAGRQYLRVTPTPSMEPYYRADTRAFWGSLPLRINQYFDQGH